MHGLPITGNSCTNRCQSGKYQRKKGLQPRKKLHSLAVVVSSRQQHEKKGPFEKLKLPYGPFFFA